MLCSVSVRATAVEARASLKGHDGLGMGKGPNLWRSWSDGNLSYISVEAELGRPHDTVLKSFLEFSVIKSKKSSNFMCKSRTGLLFLATWIVYIINYFIENTFESSETRDVKVEVF